MVCLKDILFGRWRTKGSYVCKECHQEFQGVPNKWERCPGCTDRLQRRIEAAKSDPRLLRSA